MENTSLLTGRLSPEEIAQRISRERYPDQLLNYDEYADELVGFISIARSELRRIRAHRSTLVGRTVRLIRWASQPKEGNRQLIPGIGLELSLIGIHVVMIGASTLLLLQG